MKTPKTNFFRAVVTCFLGVALFITSFAGSPYRPIPASGGGLCNYSSWELVVMVQKSKRNTRQTSWKVLPAGSCQAERVVGVLGRTSVKNNNQPQMISINDSGTIALNSLKANPVAGLGLVAIVSPNHSARILSNREAYLLNQRLINDNPALTRLGYSLELETVKLGKPLATAGYGLPKGIGTPAHTGADIYAMDFPVVVGYDRRSPKVSAALGGQVVYSDCATDYGCAVVVRSSNINQWGVIYYAVYAHLEKDNRAAVGALLKKGDMVGRVDQSSGVESAHLHFSVRVSSLAYDGAAALYGNGFIYPINAPLYMR